MTFFGASRDLIDQISPGDIDVFFQMDNPANYGPTVDPVQLEESGVPIAVMNSPETSAEGIPATTVIEIADSGHFFVVNKLAETAAALHQWLQNYSTAARGGQE